MIPCAAFKAYGQTHHRRGDEDGGVGWDQKVKRCPLVLRRAGAVISTSRTGAKLEEGRWSGVYGVCVGGGGRRLMGLPPTVTATLPSTQQQTVPRRCHAPAGPHLSEGLMCACVVDTLVTPHSQPVHNHNPTLPHACGIPHARETSCEPSTHQSHTYQRAPSYEPQACLIFVAIYYLSLQTHSPRLLTRNASALPFLFCHPSRRQQAFVALYYGGVRRVVIQSRVDLALPQRSDPWSSKLFVGKRTFSEVVS